MTRLFYITGLLTGLALFVPAARGADAAPSEGPTGTVAAMAADTPSAPNFRISAIAGSEDDYFVGIIDQDSGDSDLLRVGDTFYGYAIEQIRPEQQEVLISRGGKRFVMFLRGDSTLVASVGDEGEYEGPVESDLDFTPPQEVKTLEDFIRENYQAAGMESPDAPIPDEYTKPVTKEEALQRMADSVGMEVPKDAFKPVSREEFLKMYDPANRQPESGQP